MRRREFSSGAVAAATIATLPWTSGDASANLGAARLQRKVAGGTNLSGMEWSNPSLRVRASTEPNIHFSVPRAAEIAYLAACGYTKNRLPIQWELLQPVLHDTVVNDEVRSAVGRPGEFHLGYESYITGVLDAHAAVGTRCIIDVHNYCRYRDFVYQPDGSVIGLTVLPKSLVRPFAKDPAQTQLRIFSLADGATLTQANFVDFWVRAARKWKGHPGFGGYGLMNEPNALPRRGSILPSDKDPVKGPEDLTIWPTYAQAAIQAIRKIDPLHPIYVAGNHYSSAMAMDRANPGFPLNGANLIYEVHLYLDAASAGHYFDYDIEVGKRFSAGFGSGSIHLRTGMDRLRMATDWAREKGVKLALGEIGMPIDDSRWQDMFRQTVGHAREAGCEVFSWMGGNHWPIRNYAINHTPGWHQNKTMEPLVSGVMKATAGVGQASLFDAGAGFAEPGKPVTITVYARGSLTSPVNLKVAADGGAVSKARLIIPVGANGSDSFTFTPAANRAGTIRYSGDGLPKDRLPPPRKVFSLADPVTHATTNLQDAALAILAKYGAAKWDMADGYTDYVGGAPAATNQAVRAVSDSGYGSSAGNAMEMLNWLNTDSAAMGDMVPPVMRVSRGKKSLDVSARGSAGLWCKKSLPTPNVQPNPRNVVPYNLDDPHFAIAAVSIPGKTSTGVVFQASLAEGKQASELYFVDGYPTARWHDARGQVVQLKSRVKRLPDRPVVLSFISKPGMQRLRVDSAVVDSATAIFAPGPYNQMLIGWGFTDYYPRFGFGGDVFVVISGKGNPSPDELAVLEQYAASLAGLGAQQS